MSTISMGQKYRKSLFDFLSLPRELRDAIIEIYVKGHSSTGTINRDRERSPKRSSRRISQRKIPFNRSHAMLYVNWQVHSEYLALVFKYTRIIFNIGRQNSMQMASFKTPPKMQQHLRVCRLNLIFTIQTDKLINKNHSKFMENLERFVTEKRSLELLEFSVGRSIQMPRAYPRPSQVQTWRRHLMTAVSNHTVTKHLKFSTLGEEQYHFSRNDDGTWDVRRPCSWNDNTWQSLYALSVEKRKSWTGPHSISECLDLIVE